MRLAVLATGEFALPTFRKLLETTHEIAALVTQPDRTGRGHHEHVNALKELAVANGIPVFQPVSVNDAAALQQLRELHADLFVVVAYGQILSAELLAIPRLGAINLHGSLLPKYRGAAPVQYAVWKGEAVTGVTIFQIEPRLDAGLMLGVVETEIGSKETSGQLHDRLAELAVPVTLQVIDQLEQGTAQGTKQHVEGVTRAPKIKKEQGRINWSLTAREVDCHVRAMQPWPQADTLLQRPDQPDLRLIVLDVDPLPDAPGARAAGEFEVRDGQWIVATGSGAVRINQVQPPGKRAMSAADFLRGTALPAGSRLV